MVRQLVQDIEVKEMKESGEVRNPGDEKGEQC